MRNIINIDYCNSDSNGYLNSAFDSNELHITIKPVKEQLTNYKVEVIDVAGESHISDVLTSISSFYGNVIEYDVQEEFYNGNGIMKIRLLSDEGNSDYYNFTCIAFTQNDDIVCKYAKGVFVFSKSTVTNSIIDLMFPVGSVITNSKADFDPNELYAGTTWERIKGRVVVGVDEDDTDFNQTGKTGGTKVHGHYHITGTSFDGNNIFIAASPGLPSSTVTTTNRAVVNVASKGTGAARQDSTYYANVNVLQPYITKYVWERVG